MSKIINRIRERQAQAKLNAIQGQFFELRKGLDIVSVQSSDKAPLMEIPPSRQNFPKF